MQTNRSIRKLFSFLLLFLASLFSTAYAQCTLNVQSVIFGNYDVFDNNYLEGVGNVNVTCDVSSFYTIALSPGNGAFTNRLLLNGQHELIYNLFVDPARTIVWGDGTAASSTVSGMGTNSNFPVYGRIPARQNVYVGNYQDSVTVTLVF